MQDTLYILNDKLVDKSTFIQYQLADTSLLRIENKLDEIKTDNASEHLFLLVILVIILFFK